MTGQTRSPAGRLVRRAVVLLGRRSRGALLLLLDVVEAFFELVDLVEELLDGLVAVVDLAASAGGGGGVVAGGGTVAGGQVPGDAVFDFVALEAHVFEALFHVLEVGGAVEDA